MTFTSNFVVYFCLLVLGYILFYSKSNWMVEFLMRLGHVRECVRFVILVYHSIIRLTFPYNVIFHAIISFF